MIKVADIVKAADGVRRFDGDRSNQLRIGTLSIDGDEWVFKYTDEYVANGGEPLPFLRRMTIGDCGRIFPAEWRMKTLPVEWQKYAERAKELKMSR